MRGLAARAPVVLIASALSLVCARCGLRRGMQALRVEVSEVRRCDLCGQVVG